MGGYTRLIKRGLHQAFVLIALMQINLTVYAYSELIIFGDSLSDTGNHYGSLFGGLPPPYYKNRISNGPVAVDVLAEGLGLSAANSGFLLGNGSGSNYAVSGANAAGSDPHDLSAQVQAFLNRSPEKLDRRALYLIMIGGNDVRDASVMDSSVRASAAIVSAVDTIKFALQLLIQKGARSILVVNVPDISSIPETAERAQGNPGLLSIAAQLSRNFNEGLEQRLEGLDATPGVKIVQFDIYTSFNTILENPGKYGFSNTNEACFDPDTYQFHPQCDFDKFVFFDSIHPSAKTHRLLGQDMLRLLKRGTGAIEAVGAILLLLLG